MTNEEIYGVLKKRSDALIRKDIDFFRNFLDDDFLYVNSLGTSFNKSSYCTDIVLSEKLHFVSQECSIISTERTDSIINVNLYVSDCFIWENIEYKVQYRSNHIYKINDSGILLWLFGYTYTQGMQENKTLTIPHLIGNSVELCPLSMNYVECLWRVASDETIWQWTLQSVTSLNEMMEYCAEALYEYGQGNAIPFIIKEKNTGNIIGSTRFGSIDMDNKHMEIGWTWIGSQWQKTSVNTETKYLMLSHAFEELGINRISIITDKRNLRSQKAIERLGFVKEGTIRNHLITHNGYVRDSLCYSMIRDEWDAHKVHIEQLLSKDYG